MLQYLNLIRQSNFACTPNLRHAVMALNVATKSERVIQIQMTLPILWRLTEYSDIFSQVRHCVL